MLDLERQYHQVREEVLAAVVNVCASQHYILGAEVEEFEHEMAGFRAPRLPSAVHLARTHSGWLLLLRECAPEIK